MKENSRASESKLPAGLYLVGTPIGNLEDITYRAIRVLRMCDLILAEDTRETRKLMDHYGIRTPLLSCHKFNEAARVPEVLEHLRAGSSVALVSESGMPGISDPGSRLARACHDEGIAIFVIPGPSAVTAAVAACGFVARGFVFEGFLPHKGLARTRRLERLLQWDMPVVLYESPHRLIRLLEELEQLSPNRIVYVGRELTKLHEEHRKSRPTELLAYYRQHGVRGEIVVIIDAP